MEKDITDNPFAALFPSITAAQEFSANIGQTTSPKELPERIQNEIVQSIFCITLNKDYVPFSQKQSTCLIYLSELHSEIKKSVISSDIIDQAVFERLMLPSVPQNDIIMSDSCNEELMKHVTEKKAIVYLYFCFTKLKAHQCKNQVEEDFLDLCKSVILKNSITALSNICIFDDDSASEQLYNLICERDPSILDYLNALSSHVYNEKQLSGVCHVFETLFKYFNYALSESSLHLADSVHYISLLHSMVSQCPFISEALTLFSTPQDTSKGNSYEMTILGTILCTSCLPMQGRTKYPFFQNPSRSSSQEHQITQTNICKMLSQRTMLLSDLFYVCLKASAKSRNHILNWFGNCLKANSGRSRLSSREHLLPGFDLGFASDGFMLNLTSVFLHLCKPFLQRDKLTLLMKIDPSYFKTASKVEASSDEQGIHLRVAKDETCLIPTPEDFTESYFSQKTYNFSTECFFMTHLCLYSGFCVVHSKLLKVSQALSHQQHMYEEVRAQGGSENSEAAQSIHSTMDKNMTQFLSLKAALLVPDTLEMMMQFLAASSNWLVNKAQTSDNRDITKSVSFPLSDICSKNLACIPEYLLENIADFVIFLRRFSPQTLELHGPSLDNLMTLILTFMGNSNVVKNPHLRAKLAEMLECLMPHDEEEGKSHNIVASYHRTYLFQSHPYISQLMRTLLDVFVSIEMTGQSVEFEQKFNYRRPMYSILKYILNVESHRNSLKVLAEEAEQDIESIHPPLFLRFINLLINDAHFLLDEALSYMSQLREHQLRQDQQEYSSQRREQRNQNEQNFQHMGMLARFHNVMSNETIHTLVLITNSIKSIFMHSVMVDRVAVMLNYFLVHLVGPKKKKLKVKNLSDFEFKPHEIVSDICQIYLNLGYTDDDSNQFCSAITGDSRSYSPLLFEQAIAVLQKIGKATLIADFEEFSIKIKKIYAGNQKIEEALFEAPEEFLDPIMNTIMTDPVLLPTSSMIVDRSTILRHLLSDQTDPFNRSPLNMEMVKTDEVLKSKIQDWMSSHQQS